MFGSLRPCKSSLDESLYKTKTVQSGFGRCSSRADHRPNPTDQKAARALLRRDTQEADEVQLTAEEQASVALFTAGKVWSERTLIMVLLPFWARLPAAPNETNTVSLQRRRAIRIRGSTGVYTWGSKTGVDFLSPQLHPMIFTTKGLTKNQNAARALLRRDTQLAVETQLTEELLQASAALVVVGRVCRERTLIILASPNSRCERCLRCA